MRLFTKINNLGAVLFVTRFVIVYFFLSTIYQFYLKSFEACVDPLTALTSDIVYHFLSQFFEDISAILHPNRPSIVYYYQAKSIFQIVEGCNAMSVCITFVSFNFAYSFKWTRTLLFSILGVFSILLMNLSRILALGMFYINDYEYVHLVHDTIFPASIYGFVFLLWIWWINYTNEKALRN